MAICADCGERIPIGKDVCPCFEAARERYFEGLLKLPDPFPEPIVPLHTVTARQAVERVCRHCGVAFRTTGSYEFECSRECGSAYYEAHYFRDRQCFHCGKRYRGTHSSQFCSGACRVASHRAGKKTPKNGGNGSVPTFLKLRFQILERDNFRCRYCGRGQEDGVKLQIDHVHPKAKGGKWEFNNLITACRECNLGKGDRILQARAFNEGTL